MADTSSALAYELLPTTSPQILKVDKVLQV